MSEAYNFGAKEVLSNGTVIFLKDEINLVRESFASDFIDGICQFEMKYGRKPDYVILGRKQEEEFDKLSNLSGAKEIFGYGCRSMFHGKFMGTYFLIDRGAEDYMAFYEPQMIYAKKS